MAKEIVFVINADTTQTVKSLEDLEGAIESLKSELKKTDLGSDEFKRLSGQLQNAQSEVKSLEKTFEGLEAEKKVEAFAKVGEAVAGGFAAATGAMALFGEESEAVTKLAAQSQQAVAVAMGLRSVAEGVVQAGIAKRIALETASAVATRATMVATTAYNLVVNGTVGVMKLLRIAMASTGILALAVGLGLIITNFGSIKKVVLDVINRFSILKVAVEALTSIWTTFSEAVGLADTAEEKRLATAQKNIEVSNQRQKQLQREIDLLEAQGASEEEVYNKQVEIYKSRIKAEIELYNAKLANGEATKEEREALNDLGTEYAVFLATRKRKLDEERDKALEAQKEKNAKLKEEQKKYLSDLNTQLQDITIRNISNQVEREIKAEQLALQRKLAAIRGNSEIENKLRVELQKESETKISEIKRKQFEEDQKVNKEEAAKVQEEYYRNAIANIEARILGLSENSLALVEAQREQATLERDEALNNENLTKGEVLKINEEYNAKLKEISDAQLEYEKNLAQQKKDAVLFTANSTLSALTAIADLANANGQKQSAAQKALAVASLAVNTAVSLGNTIAGATAAAAAGGPAAPFLLAGYIATGVATVLTNFASAKKLLSGASSATAASGTAGGAGSVQAPVLTDTSTTSRQDVERKDSSINVKAYVVESEMTDAQKNAQKTKQLSTI